MQVVIEVCKVVGVDIIVKTRGNAITVWVKDTENERSRALLFKRPVDPSSRDNYCEAVGEFCGFDELHEAIKKINGE